MFHKMCEKFQLGELEIKEFARFINGLETDLWSELDWMEEMEFFLEMGEDKELIFEFFDNQLLANSQYEY